MFAKKKAIISIFLPLVFLAILISGIFYMRQILIFDFDLDQYLTGLRSEKSINFFLWITSLGSLKILWFFLLSSIALFWIWGKKNYIIPLSSGLLGSELAVYIMKSVINRPRPIFAVYQASFSSFPSGHSAAAIAFYGFLAYFFIKNFHGLWGKILPAINLILIAAIGFSRLFLGVHYFSDVIGGYLLGIIFLNISILMTKKEDQAFLFTNRFKKLEISIGIIASAIIYYIILGFNYNP